MKPQPLDLTGKRIGRLLVVRKAPKDGWLCICDCGTERILRSCHLLGTQRSCGCGRRDLDAIRAERLSKDLSGQRFGALVAEVRDASVGKPGSYWRCRCDCGGWASVRGTALSSGHTKSCGCRRRTHSGGIGAVADLTGLVFGRLTVEERAASTGQGASWVCRCECGVAIAARAKDLKDGNTASCGCLKQQKALENAEATGRVNALLMVFPPDG